MQIRTRTRVLLVAGLTIVADSDEAAAREL
jgi:hypothetical protein